MTPAVEKICVHCHKDCSTKPRVKDSHGNYYCKACHTAAAEREPQEQVAPASDPFQLSVDPSSETPRPQSPESEPIPAAKPAPIAVNFDDDDDALLPLDDSFTSEPLDDSFAPEPPRDHDHDHGDLLDDDPISVTAQDDELLLDDTDPSPP